MTSNEKIFAGREQVKEVVELEIQQLKQFNVKAQSGVLLPQLTDSLKIHFPDLVANKALTEVHVAVAPSVSYE